MIETLPEISKKDILAFLSQIKPSLEKEGVEKIGLYGSYAKEQADLYSDIDIAVKLKQEYLTSHDAWDYFNLINRIKAMISEKFSRHCNVLDLESDSFIINTVKDEIHYI